MTVRRIVPGFVIGAGAVALACWLPVMVLLWMRLPLLLPSPSDPWVVQAGLAALLLAAAAIAAGLWLVSRAGRTRHVGPGTIQPNPEDGTVVQPVARLSGREAGLTSDLQEDQE